MGNVDWVLIGNWIGSGLIGLLFGSIGGYITYRLQRNRDDLLWEREKAKLEMSWQQKLHELEIQFMRQEQNQLREHIMKGVDNPARQIDIISIGNERIINFYKHCSRIVELSCLLYSSGVQIDEIEAALIEANKHKALQPSKSPAE